MDFKNAKRVHCARDAAAAELLADAEFSKAWSDLYQACPWATAAQSHAYASIWYSVYSDVFELILLYGHTEHSPDEPGLFGLLSVARHRKTGRLTTVGDLQGEYKVWLTPPGQDDSFIEAAMDQLAQPFPGARLRFNYLPVGTPHGWLTDGRWADRVRVEKVDRPLMFVGQGSEAVASISKKRYRSRLQRLSKLGPVELQVLRSRRDLEPRFDQLISYYDLRQGAVNGIAPFHDDPRKREFYARLAAAPELLHGSVLRAGDSLIAAHFGLRNRDSLQLGVVIHSPFFAEHSPGTLLILQLAQQLQQDGVEYLDLTPGQDAYKERITTHHTEVHILDVFFDAAAAQRAARKDYALQLAKRLLPRFGVTPQRARRMAAALRKMHQEMWRGGLLRPLRAMARSISDGQEVCWYVMPLRDATRQQNPDQSDTRFRHNALADLLLYEANRPGDRTRTEMLSFALAQLETGAQMYTVIDGNRLQHCSWIQRPGIKRMEGPLQAGIPTDVVFPANSMLLAEEYTHPAAQGLTQASLAHRLNQAAAVPDIEFIFIAASVTAHPSDTDQQRAIEAAGFKPYGKLVSKVRFGRHQCRWEPAEGNPPAKMT